VLTNGRFSYVLVVRFAAALLKASLIACPALCSEATAIKEIKTNSKAYSVIVNPDLRLLSTAV
jgi:hypothetical protein